MRLSALMVAAGLMLTACDFGSPTAAEPPTGDRELVLRMVQLPGLLPPGGGLTRPSLSVYGSGLAIVETRTGFVQRQLTRAGIRKIIQAAAAAGLARDREGGTPSGPDAGSVTFVVLHEGERHVNRVVSPTGEVRSFMDELAHLDGFLGTEIGPHATPYEPDSVAVWAQPEQTSGGARDWKLGDLATAGEPYGTGRCQVLRGQGAAGFLKAKSGDWWRSGDATYYVIFRPLLPDEEECPRVESLAVS